MKLNRTAFGIVALFVVFVLVQALAVKLFSVPSESMTPTLQTGNYLSSDRILVNRLAYVNTESKPGDVIVFREPASWDGRGSEELWPVAVLKNLSDFVGIGPGVGNVLVKRVAAGPGDLIGCCDASGRLTLNGKPVLENYVHNNFAFEPAALDCQTKPRSLRCFDEITVPKKHLLVLGDNRAVSRDSLIYCRNESAQTPACIRFLPQQNIIGSAFAIIFPLNRIGWLN